MSIEIVTKETLELLLNPDKKYHDNDANPSEKKCSCKSRKKKAKKKVVSLKLADMNGKAIDGLIKDENVVLNVKHENLGCDTLILDLSDCKDFVFEYQGEELKPGDVLKLTPDVSKIELKAKFAD